ncbi:unnamed protein product [Amoebophrya sp. A120]|nr:unnamed protein product [Amoebophrya sp. A120]|eukprot:GSA120T00017014001.1
MENVSADMVKNYQGHLGRDDEDHNGEQPDAKKQRRDHDLRHVYSSSNSSLLGGASSSDLAGSGKDAYEQDFLLTHRGKEKVYGRRGKEDGSTSATATGRVARGAPRRDEEESRTGRSGSSRYWAASTQDHKRAAREGKILPAGAGDESHAAREVVDHDAKSAGATSRVSSKISSRQKMFAQQMLNMRGQPGQVPAPSSRSWYDNLSLYRYEALFERVARDLENNRITGIVPDDAVIQDDLHTQPGSENSSVKEEDGLDVGSVSATEEETVETGARNDVLVVRDRQLPPGEEQMRNSTTNEPTSRAVSQSRNIETPGGGPPHNQHDGSEMSPEELARLRRLKKRTQNRSKEFRLDKNTRSGSSDLFNRSNSIKLQGLMRNKSRSTTNSDYNFLTNQLAVATGGGGAQYREPASEDFPDLLSRSGTDLDVRQTDMLTRSGSNLSLTAGGEHHGLLPQSGSSDRAGKVPKKSNKHKLMRFPTNFQAPVLGLAILRYDDEDQDEQEEDHVGEHEQTDRNDVAAPSRQEMTQSAGSGTPPSDALFSSGTSADVAAQQDVDVHTLQQSITATNCDENATNLVPTVNSTESTSFNYSKSSQKPLKMGVATPEDDKGCGLKPQSVYDIVDLSSTPGFLIDEYQHGSMEGIMPSDVEEKKKHMKNYSSDIDKKPTSSISSTSPDDSADLCSRGRVSTELSEGPDESARSSVSKEVGQEMIISDTTNTPAGTTGSTTTTTSGLTDPAAVAAPHLKSTLLSTNLAPQNAFDFSLRSVSAPANKRRLSTPRRSRPDSELTRTYSRKSVFRMHSLMRQDSLASGRSTSRPASTTGALAEVDPIKSLTFGGLGLNFASAEQAADSSTGTIGAFLANSAPGSGTMSGSYTTGVGDHDAYNTQEHAFPDQPNTWHGGSARFERQLVDLNALFEHREEDEEGKIVSRSGSQLEGTTTQLDDKSSAGTSTTSGKNILAKPVSEEAVQLSPVVLPNNANVNGSSPVVSDKRDVSTATNSTAEVMGVVSTSPSETSSATASPIFHKKIVAVLSSQQQTPAAVDDVGKSTTSDNVLANSQQLLSPVIEKTTSLGTTSTTVVQQNSPASYGGGSGPQLLLDGGLIGGHQDELAQTIVPQGVVAAQANATPAADYPLVLEKVQGLTPVVVYECSVVEETNRKPFPDEVLKAFATSLQKLNNDDNVGFISGEDGLMSSLQVLAHQVTKKPCCMSPLLLLPTYARCYRPGSKFLICTVGLENDSVYLNIADLAERAGYTEQRFRDLFLIERFEDILLQSQDDLEKQGEMILDRICSKFRGIFRRSTANGNSILTQEQLPEAQAEGPGATGAAIPLFPSVRSTSGSRTSIGAADGAGGVVQPGEMESENAAKTKAGIVRASERPGGEGENNNEQEHQPRKTTRSLPRCSGIFVECAEMTVHSDLLREELGVPVWDMVSLSHALMLGYLENPLFGRLGWQVHGSGGTATAPGLVLTQDMQPQQLNDLNAAGGEGSEELLSEINAADNDKPVHNEPSVDENYSIVPDTTTMTTGAVDVDHLVRVNRRKSITRHFSVAGSSFVHQKDDQVEQNHLLHLQNVELDLRPSVAQLASWAGNKLVDDEDRACYAAQRDQVKALIDYILAENRKLVFDAATSRPRTASGNVINPVVKLLPESATFLSTTKKQLTNYAVDAGVQLSSDVVDHTSQEVGGAANTSSATPAPPTSSATTTSSFQHPALGCLRLDSLYRPAAGDVADPRSHEFALVNRVVPGLTFEMCRSGTLTAEVRRNFARAVKYLDKHPQVKVITGDCGFMMFFQELAQAFTRKPVCMSSLMLITGLNQFIHPDKQIAILTANSTDLEDLIPVVSRVCGVGLQAFETDLVKENRDLASFISAASSQASFIPRGLMGPGWGAAPGGPPRTPSAISVSSATAGGGAPGVSASAAVVTTSQQPTQDTVFEGKILEIGAASDGKDKLSRPHAQHQDWQEKHDVENQMYQQSMPDRDLPAREGVLNNPPSQLAQSCKTPPLIEENITLGTTPISTPGRGGARKKVEKGAPKSTASASNPLSRTLSNSSDRSTSRINNNNASKSDSGSTTAKNNYAADPSFLDAVATKLKSELGQQLVDEFYNSLGTNGSDDKIFTPDEQGDPVQQLSNAILPDQKQNLSISSASNSNSQSAGGGTSDEVSLNSSSKMKKKALRRMDSPMPESFVKQTSSSTTFGSFRSNISGVVVLNTAGGQDQEQRPTSNSSGDSLRVPASSPRDDVDEEDDHEGVLALSLLRSQNYSTTKLGRSSKQEDIQTTLSFLAGGTISGTATSSSSLSGAGTSTSNTEQEYIAAKTKSESSSSTAPPKNNVVVVHAMQDREILEEPCPDAEVNLSLAKQEKEMINSSSSSTNNKSADPFVRNMLTEEEEETMLIKGILSRSTSLQAADVFGEKPTTMRTLKQLAADRTTSPYDSPGAGQLVRQGGAGGSSSANMFTTSPGGETPPSEEDDIVPIEIGNRNTRSTESASNKSRSTGNRPTTRASSTTPSHKGPSPGHSDSSVGRATGTVHDGDFSCPADATTNSEEDHAAALVRTSTTVDENKGGVDIKEKYRKRKNLSSTAGYAKNKNPEIYINTSDGQGFKYMPMPPADNNFSGTSGSCDTFSDTKTPDYLPSPPFEPMRVPRLTKEEREFSLDPFTMSDLSFSTTSNSISAYTTNSLFSQTNLTNYNSQIINPNVAVSPRGGGGPPYEASTTSSGRPNTTASGAGSTAGTTRGVVARRPDFPEERIEEDVDIAYSGLKNNVQRYDKFNDIARVDTKKLRAVEKLRSVVAGPASPCGSCDNNMDDHVAVAGSGLSSAAAGSSSTSNISPRGGVDMFQPGKLFEKVKLQENATLKFENKGLVVGDVQHLDNEIDCKDNNSTSTQEDPPHDTVITPQRKQLQLMMPGFDTAESSFVSSSTGAGGDTTDTTDLLFPNYVTGKNMKHTTCSTATEADVTPSIVAGRVSVSEIDEIDRRRAHQKGFSSEHPLVILDREEAARRNAALPTGGMIDPTRDLPFAFSPHGRTRADQVDQQQQQPGAGTVPSSLESSSSLFRGNNVENPFANLMIKTTFGGGNKTKTPDAVDVRAASTTVVLSHQTTSKNSTAIEALAGATPASEDTTSTNQVDKRLESYNSTGTASSVIGAPVGGVVGSAAFVPRVLSSPLAGVTPVHEQVEDAESHDEAQQQHVESPLHQTRTDLGVIRSVGNYNTKNSPEQEVQNINNNPRTSNRRSTFSSSDDIPCLPRTSDTTGSKVNSPSWAITTAEILGVDVATDIGLQSDYTDDGFSPGEKAALQVLVLEKGGLAAITEDQALPDDLPVHMTTSPAIPPFNPKMNNMTALQPGSLSWTGRGAANKDFDGAAGNIETTFNIPNALIEREHQREVEHHMLIEEQAFIEDPLFHLTNTSPPPGDLQMLHMMSSPSSPPSLALLSKTPSEQARDAHLREFLARNPHEHELARRQRTDSQQDQTIAETGRIADLPGGGAGAGNNKDEDEFSGHHEINSGTQQLPGQQTSGNMQLLDPRVALGTTSRGAPISFPGQDDAPKDHAQEQVDRKNSSNMLSRTSSGPHNVHDQQQHHSTFISHPSTTIHYPSLASTERGGGNNLLQKTKSNLSVDSYSDAETIVPGQEGPSSGGILNNNDYSNVNYHLQSVDELVERATGQALSPHSSSRPGSREASQISAATAGGNKGKDLPLAGANKGQQMTSRDAAKTKSKDDLLLLGSTSEGAVVEQLKHDESQHAIFKEEQDDVDNVLATGTVNYWGTLLGPSSEMVRQARFVGQNKPLQDFLLEIEQEKEQMLVKSKSHDENFAGVADLQGEHLHATPSRSPSASPAVPVVPPLNQSQMKLLPRTVSTQSNTTAAGGDLHQTALQRQVSGLELMLGTSTQGQDHRLQHNVYGSTSSLSALYQHIPVAAPSSAGAAGAAHLGDHSYNPYDFSLSPGAFGPPAATVIPANLNIGDPYPTDFTSMPLSPTAILAYQRQKFIGGSSQHSVSGESLNSFGRSTQVRGGVTTGAASSVGGGTAPGPPFAGLVRAGTAGASKGALSDAGMTNYTGYTGGLQYNPAAARESQVTTPRYTYAGLSDQINSVGPHFGTELSHLQSRAFSTEVHLGGGGQHLAGTTGAAPGGGAAKTSTTSQVAAVEPVARHIDRQRFVVMGIEDLPNFDGISKGYPLQFHNCEELLIQKIQRLMDAHPDIDCFLVECTQLPMFSDSLRALFQKPVYDITSAAHMMMLGFQTTPKCDDELYKIEDAQPYCFGMELGAKDRRKCLELQRFRDLFDEAGIPLDKDAESGDEAENETRRDDSRAGF